MGTLLQCSLINEYYYCPHKQSARFNAKALNSWSTNAITKPANIKTNLSAQTQWWAVALLFAAGCSTSLHIGKVPSALPLLRAEWDLSLAQAGLVVSIYALLIATCGLLLGVLVQRIGNPRLAIVGVGIVGVGSLLGAQSQEFHWLLATRSLEGLGWIMAVIAIPPLLVALCHARDRPLVMGIWGAFVPLGAGVMLLLSPMALSMGGWRFSWILSGLFSLLAAALIMMVLRAHAMRIAPVRSEKGDAGKQFTDLKKSLIWMLSGCFLLYSLQFVSVTSFLPTLLLDTTSLSLDAASRITALVIISNTVGNVIAGYLMRRGTSHVPVLVAGALGMGIFAVFVFNETVSVSVRLACAFGASIFGGLIPGTCFATLPKAISVVSASGLLIGLMMQCAGIGQLLGGVVVPVAVDYAGAWEVAGFVLLAIGALGALFAVRSADGQKA